MPFQIKRLFMLCCFILTTSCTTGIPQNIQPVTAFDLNRYLGQWYEIARLDHKFEQNLHNVTANYSLNTDGTVHVINRGFNSNKQQWQQAQGKAKFVKTSDIGYLKVSFFGPFYGSYIIFHLEPDYSAALVSSYNYDYFWILSRNKTLPPLQLQKYLNIAKEAGFNVEQLIYPQQ